MVCMEREEREEREERVGAVGVVGALVGAGAREHESTWDEGTAGREDGRTGFLMCLVGAVV
jgi:hypothetical protein